MDGSELKVGFIDFFLFIKDALGLAATKTLPVQSTIVDQFHLNSACMCLNGKIMPVHGSYHRFSI